MTKQTTFWNAAATPAVISRMARESFEPHKASTHRRIIRQVCRGMDQGRFGATCDEVETATGMCHQTVSSCINAMYTGEEPVLRLTGAQRLTRRGRKANVYEIMPDAPLSVIEETPTPN